MSLTKEKISSLMKTYVECGEKIAKLEQEQTFIRELVRKYLKENKLTFLSNSNNIATLSAYKRETVDKEKVKKILTEEQYKEVLKITDIETVKIMSEWAYENMKRFREKKNDELIPVQSL